MKIETYKMKTKHNFSDETLERWTIPIGWSLTPIILKNARQRSDPIKGTSSSLCRKCKV